jgi:HSP20 family protein
MFGQWNDFERTFAAMDQVRRRMEQAVGEWNGVARFEATSGWPRVNLRDDGDKLVMEADVPGLTEKDIQVQLTQDVLTISGERPVPAPEGYSVHRQERVPVQFSRSFTLPCRVSGDAIAASLENGVLTVTLPKAPESQPRQIAVKAA